MPSKSNDPNPIDDLTLPGTKPPASVIPSVMDNPLPLIIVYKLQ